MIKKKDKTLKGVNSSMGLLEKMVVPSYKEVKEKIVKKIGRLPELPKDLPSGDWTEQSLRVLNERYLRKDKEGKVIETPEQMCWRVSWEIASAEALWGKGRNEVKRFAREYYQMLISKKFLPNSPTLMNAGAENNMQYSACFVLPVEDSLIGIFDALKYQALIHQTGGGTGFSFSRLRPKGSIVRSSGGVASGPVSFMRIFDSATNEIKQGGKRRGANMGILRVDHPDIMEFIHCKDDGGITNFNISVAITNEFMKAYESDTNYDLIDPKKNNKIGELSARKVFDEIKAGAWKTGDPGIVFIDRMNEGSSNPVPAIGPIEATNPCGEQPLYPFDACNLGSIFLGYFVKDGKKGKEIDWEELTAVTQKAVRFLDSVIEVNPFPIEQIRKTVTAIRRIGLGIGGWADMLIELGIAYDSDEALSLAEKVMSFIQKEAVKETKELAKERGEFPLWSESIYKNSDKRRNSTVTTIAPTGTISIIAGASSGIEPLFAIAYQHIVKDKSLDRTLTFVNPKFEEIASKEGFWSEEIRKKVAENGVVRDIPEIPAHIKEIFGTAHEIHHDWHIKMQTAFQKYTDNAVSKTINMENSVTPEEIGDAYMLAWDTGCKGVTVFRDGCKDAQVLNLGIKDSETKAEEQYDATLIRPFKVTGATYKLDTPVGSAFITINEDETGEPLEVFVNVGKAGSDVTAMAEALGRMISTALRFRGHLKPVDRAQEIAHQLSGIGGRHSVGFGPKKILSLPDAVSIALSNHFGFKINGKGQALSVGNQDVANKTHLIGTNHTNGANHTNGHSDPGKQEILSLDAKTNLSLFTKQESMSMQVLSMEAPKVGGDICPSCGASSLFYQEGCVKCLSCGHSEC
jgi:ribonucleoside-diphosphate reductase alpha chain